MARLTRRGVSKPIDRMTRLREAQRFESVRRLCKSAARRLDPRLAYEPMAVVDDAPGRIERTSLAGDVELVPLSDADDVAQRFADRVREVLGLIAEPVPGVDHVRRIVAAVPE